MLQKNMIFPISDNHLFKTPFNLVKINKTPNIPVYTFSDIISFHSDNPLPCGYWPLFSVRVYSFRSL